MTFWWLFFSFNLYLSIGKNHFLATIWWNQWKFHDFSKSSKKRVFNHDLADHENKHMFLMIFSDHEIEWNFEMENISSKLSPWKMIHHYLSTIRNTITTKSQKQETTKKLIVRDINSASEWQRTRDTWSWMTNGTYTSNIKYCMYY